MTGMQLATLLIPVVVLVAGFDLLFAFLRRAQKEVTGGSGD